MEILTTIFILFVITYTVARIVNISEENKTKAILKEYERTRQRKIKSLYEKDED